MKLGLVTLVFACIGSHSLPSLAEPSARFADAPAPLPGAARSIPAVPPTWNGEPSTPADECAGANLLLARARRFSTHGNVLSALATYSRAVALNSQCGAATLELASLRARLGDFSEAERLFNRAVHLRAHAPEAFKARAVMRRKQGQRAAALSDLGAAVAMRPDDIENIRLLADWFIEERAWPAALAQCRALVRILDERQQASELEQAELRVRALAIMAAETDPVAEGAASENWVRRSLSKLARR